MVDARHELKHTIVPVNKVERPVVCPLPRNNVVASRPTGHSKVGHSKVELATSLLSMKGDICMTGCWCKHTEGSDYGTWSGENKKNSTKPVSEKGLDLNLNIQGNKAQAIEGLAIVLITGPT